MVDLHQNRGNVRILGKSEIDQHAIESMRQFDYFHLFARRNNGYLFGNYRQENDGFMNDLVVLEIMEKRARNTAR